MGETLIGVDYRTARRAGLVAVIVVVVNSFVLEPRLQAAGLGVLALLIYAVAVPVVLWSLLEDFRHLLQ